MYNPHEGKPFRWCPNPAHGMHDYFDVLPDGRMKCTTCGYILSDNGSKKEEE